MKPLLTHSNPTLMETMPSCCLGLSRMLTSTEQLSRHPAMIGETLTDDLDPVEGNVAGSMSGSGAISNRKEGAFDFSRKSSSNNSDENGFEGSGGITARQPRFETNPTQQEKNNARILPSHI